MESMTVFVIFMVSIVAIMVLPFLIYESAYNNVCSDEGLIRGEGRTCVRVVNDRITELKEIRCVGDMFFPDCYIVDEEAEQ